MRHGLRHDTACRGGGITRLSATVRLGEPGFGRWLKMGRAALRRSLARERKHR